MFNPSRHLARTSLAVLLCLAFAFAPVVAAQASDFALRSLDGRQVAANDLRGKVTVLAFGASWLPLSREQVQGVQRLSDEFGRRGVEVFWVSTDSEQARSKNFASDEQLRSFAGKNNLRVPVLRDPEGAASRSFGVDQLPTVVILDKQGNLAGAPVGGLDAEGKLVEKLRSRIESLL